MSYCKKPAKDLLLLLLISLCLGRSTYANPLPDMHGLIYSDCVASVGRERCAALAMARSLCKARISESQGTKWDNTRISNDYLDTLAAMNIKENELLNANLAYSKIVTELSAGIMYRHCPSALRSENEARPIFAARMDTMLFGVYRQSLLRALLIEAKADADCKSQDPYDKCMRARQQFYLKTLWPESRTE
jgi:hypothetical protein